jgi:hypothetical protein
MMAPEGHPEAGTAPGTLRIAYPDADVMPRSSRAGISIRTKFEIFIENLTPFLKQ